MNKWLKKGPSKTLALCGMLGLLLTPLNVFNNQMHRPQMMQCPMGQMCTPEQIRENNMHIMVTPESLMGLHLNELLKMVIEDALQNNCLHELPPGVLTCYEQLENGEQSLHVQDLAQALPVVVEKLTQMMKSRGERAPRPDAPGNSDGAPVGSLLECNFTEVLQLIQQLQNIVNQCCDEIQIDFNGVFTAIASIDCGEIVLDITGVFTALVAIEVDVNATLTTVTEISNTLTTCCAGLNATLATDFAGTFTLLNVIASSTCCDVIGLQTDNPPGSTSNPYGLLPTSTDTYLTTTFNVIEWLKAIYIRLGQHAGF